MDGLNIASEWTTSSMCVYMYFEVYVVGEKRSTPGCLRQCFTNWHPQIVQIFMLFRQWFFTSGAIISKINSADRLQLALDRFQLCDFATREFERLGDDQVWLRKRGNMTQVMGSIVLGVIALPYRWSVLY